MPKPGMNRVVPLFAVIKLDEKQWLLKRPDVPEHQEMLEAEMISMDVASFIINPNSCFSYQKWHLRHHSCRPTDASGKMPASFRPGRIGDTSQGACALHRRSCFKPRMVVRQLEATIEISTNELHVLFSTNRSYCCKDRNTAFVAPYTESRWFRRGKVFRYIPNMS